MPKLKLSIVESMLQEHEEDDLITDTKSEDHWDDYYDFNRHPYEELFEDHDDPRDSFEEANMDDKDGFWPSHYDPYYVYEFD